MTGGRIGRIIVASLHQAIADIAPTRLEFYESWLNSAGLRQGTIGLAAMVGVVGFLRGEETYQLITMRAGEYAASWTVSALPKAKRALLRVLPKRLRARWALRMAREMFAAAYPGTRTGVKIRSGRALLDIRGSLFCTIREAPPQPLCTFYAAAAARMLELFDVPAVADISACHALGARTCVMSIVLGAQAPGDEDTVAV